MRNGKWKWVHEENPMFEIIHWVEHCSPFRFERFVITNDLIKYQMDGMKFSEVAE